MPNLSGIKVRVATISGREMGPPESSWHSTASVESDLQGHFRVPVIASGEIVVFADVPEQFGMLLDMPDKRPSVAPGQTSLVDVPLRKTAPVTQLVRDAQTKQPIPGVRIYFDPIEATTGADGCFTARLLPGKSYRTIYDLPAPYVSRAAQFITTPEANGTKLDPVEFYRGRTIEGTVVTLAGQPFEGVSIAVDWNDPAENLHLTPRGQLSSRAETTTDARGRFRIDRAHPDLDVTLTPHRSNVILGDTITIPVGHKGPVELMTKAFKFIPLSGRILDEKRQPVARAEISISAKQDGKTRQVHYTNTDADGRFATPPLFPQDLAYRFEARFDARDTRSNWIVPEADGSEFQDLTIDFSRPLPVRPKFPQP